MPLTPNGESPAGECAPTFSDPDNPSNEYRCFTVDHGQDDTFFITGLNARIDKLAISHHLTITRVPGDSPEAIEGRQPGGFDCYDNAGVALSDDGLLQAWAPGQAPLVFEEGHGLRIEPDDAFILQMHYFANDAAAIEEGDQSGYEFTTTTSVEREVLMFPFGPTGFRIPAGEANHSETLSFTIPNGLAARAHGTFPHMHVLGSSYRLWVEHQDGTETCGAESERWDFDNQITYMFNESILLQGGDKIHFECTWDNSASNPDQINDDPAAVRYGERTDEEMCFAFTFLSLGP